MKKHKKKKRDQMKTYISGSHTISILEVAGVIAGAIAAHQAVKKIYDKPIRGRPNRSDKQIIIDLNPEDYQEIK